MMRGARQHLRVVITGASSGIGAATALVGLGIYLLARRMRGGH